MWALDLGTTNTILACWDSVSDRPRLIELAALCRHSEDADPLEAPRAIPSAVEVIENPGWVARLGASGFLARQTFLGRLAHIGRPALEANAVLPRRTFAPTFKRQLARSPLVTLARAGARGVSAREVARLFLRELLAEVNGL